MTRHHTTGENRWHVTADLTLEYAKKAGLFSATK
jgi:hypothetical protein